MNDEYSAETESHHDGKDHGQAEIHDDEEDKVEVVVPPINDQAEETNRRLAENKERQLQYKQLVQTG